MVKYFYTIIFALLTGLLLITLTYAGCVETSYKIYDRATRWGYQARIVKGVFEGKRHQWVEYYTKGEWRVWDDAIWYVGKSRWTAKELGYQGDK